MHASHAVAPSRSWNVPAAHLVHASCIGWSLNVPALQLVAAALPTGQKVPSGHVTHSAALVAPFASVVRSDGQSGKLRSYAKATTAMLTAIAASPDGNVVVVARLVRVHHN